MADLYYVMHVVEMLGQDVRNQAVRTKMVLSGKLELFPYLGDLKNEQRECIEALMQKKDVLGLLLTGFGKSLIYQLFPRIFVLVTGKNELL